MGDPFANAANTTASLWTCLWWLILNILFPFLLLTALISKVRSKKKDTPGIPQEVKNSDIRFFGFLLLLNLILAAVYNSH